MSKRSLMMGLGLVLLFSMLFAGCVTTPAPNNTTLVNATATPGFVNVTAAVNHTTATVAPSLSVQPNLTPALGNLTANGSLNTTAVNTINTTASVKPSATPTEYMEQDSGSGSSGAGVVTFTTVVSTPTGTVSNNLASYPIDSAVLTTHDRVVLPVSVPSSSPTVFPYDVANYSRYGYGVWQYGQGLGYEKRLDLVSPTYNNTSVSHTANLLHFFDITDVHISDKETPAQGIFFGYSPAMLSTTQVLDAAVQTINALHKAEPFDFGISLGDVANNEQYNELRWYIDVLDGKVINPDSGVKDDPVPGPLNDYQDEYKAAGLNTTIPWYQTLGNHDQFWGGFPINDYFRQTLIGEDILNLGNNSSDPHFLDTRGFYMGSIDGRTPYGDIIGVGPTQNFTEPPKVLAADPNRRAISRSEWMSEFFNTTSSPKGHGFNQSDVPAGFASYSFEPKSDLPIKVIVLDDTQKDTSAGIGPYAAYASLDNERYDWLVQELDRGQAEGKLMIIAAHIPIRDESPNSSQLWYSTSPVSEQKLIAKLHTYPNLILWMSGHIHQNTVTALRSPDPDHPELGFWEVETASLRDFPQQFRTFEIFRNSDKTISIVTTDVDPAVKEGSIAAKSRSYAVATKEIFNYTPRYLPSGSYNAELVKQLSTEMQSKIQNYGTPIGK